MPARAITISGSNPNDLNVSYGQTVHDMDLSGVALVITSFAGCSGTLLSDGYSILTAGHCITSGYGRDAYGSSVVSFLGPDGLVIQPVSSITVHSGWNGDVRTGVDLAVLHLASAAPEFAARYQLFTGPPTTATDVIAGYGFGGTGATGADGSAYPFGTLRAGTNQYVATGSYIGWSDSLLLAQFYDPFNPNTNVLNSATPYWASDSADIAPGDSGGPTFQNGRLIGVHDSLICFTDGVSCLSPLPENNSSYGQFFSDVSVAANYDWIVAAQTADIPEPGTVAMVLAGLGIIAIGRRRRI